MKKILKTSLVFAGTISVGYFIAQKELDYNLGIYDAFYSKLFQTSPKHAVQLMKFMSFQNLLWKQQIQADSKTVGPITFKNQLGLASGFDNDGTLIESLQNLGFGFIEIGSITAQKSITVNEDINQYQLKNNVIEYFSELQQMGILKTKAMLTSLRRNYAITVPIGVNIMPSEDIYKYTPYLIPNDIGNITRELCTLADYLTLNLVSGQRTSKLYNEIISNNLTLIQEMIQTIKVTQTEEIGLQAALEYEQQNQIEGDGLVSNYLSTIKLGLKSTVKTPLFVKISSNQSKDIIDYLVTSAIKNDIQGIVIQKDQNQIENDHLQQLKQIREKIPTTCSLISVGGINTKSQYQDRLKSGADACQILSSFIHKGPHIVKDIIL